MMRVAGLTALTFASSALAFAPAALPLASGGRALARTPGLALLRVQVKPEGEGFSGKLVGDTYQAQRFYVRSDRIMELVAASFPFLFRAGFGALTNGWSIRIEKDDASKYAFARFGGYMTVEDSKISQFARPSLPVQLYEFEGCPFCRKVREAVAILDLDVEFKPCPMNGPTYRPEAMLKGGKRQFPYLVDPNTNTAMYESDAIINYLFDTYGPGAADVSWFLKGPIAIITAGLALVPSNIITLAGGYKTSELPAEPLTVWGYEASPFSKVVRETMVELEIPHIWKSCARGSPKRQQLFEMTKTFQVPFLEDPNTGTKMFESAEIVDYLRATYQK
mmetsp:Transcript_69030/g.112032  ORF Transcript_69030/g.112032 Transcript_69030/m.112032 type:complete len:335 (+) Transcript_69030:1-1005(+)|eukprot:CAMPEP_0179461316 /NCGR_PEP_ID=MMETSP0799-20121207/44077_1 /TAXON_ID=46947 /ORGANISM="Geminigera cryophila, Strain CCMP2564" /LENGTH=334 /DNA_ID=CAMNT_0021263867 /DNA_START=1 /DNA_END=1005 /DNA_ORIENTATION=-